MSNTNAHKPGYKLTSLGWIPEEWKAVKFKDISKVNQGLQIPIEERLKQKIEGAKVYITIQFLNNGKDAEYILNPNESVCCNEDDVLMTRTGNTGIVITNVKGVFHNNFFKIDYDRTKINKQFLVEFLNDHKTQHILLVKAGASTIPDLNHKDFYSINLPLPLLSEQQKIAAILSTWDEAIQKSEQLIEQLKQRNKWLMQQLLSGKNRLKDFSGKWQEYAFDDCFKIIRSYSLSREYLSQQNEIDNIYCIHYGDIHALYETIFLDFNTEKRIPQIINQDFVLKEEDYLIEGDIIMADASEDYEGVGEAVEVINLNSKKAVGGLHTIVIREIKELTHKGFLAFLFDSEKVRNKLRKMATGTSVYSVSKASLKSLSFKLPKLDEQKSIGEFLSNSLAELKLYEQQLAAIQQQKKGLIQKLLSGEVRVKL